MSPTPAENKVCDACVNFGRNEWPREELEIPTDVCHHAIANVTSLLWLGKGVWPFALHSRFHT